MKDSIGMRYRQASQRDIVHCKRMGSVSKRERALGEMMECFEDGLVRWERR